MLKKISIAISAAVISAPVFALSPTTTPDIEIFMSGASAQDKSIAALFSDVCVAGTLDVFKDNGAKPGKAHSAYFCTVDTAQVNGGTPGFVNPDVLLHKRSAGGSAQGVNPVIDEVAIDAMTINNGNCTETAAGSQSWLCSIANPGDTVPVVSDAGVSDVNPELFVGANTPLGQSPVNASEVATKMEVRGAAALTFNTPVTTALRNALQVAQGLTVGADDEANMPSLSKSQVASLMQGQVNRWTSFLVNGTPLTTVAGVTGPTSPNVNVCRRVNGSGTQAQMNAKFLHYPCTAGAPVPAAAPGNPFVGPVITENSGSGDMSVCLDNANAAGNWAIGIQSTEKNADLADGYRFIKIDGVAPTLENAANGSYMDVAELTYQWRKPEFNGPDGTMLNILETIAANAASPATLATVVNASLVHSWGQGGYLALAASGHPVSSPFNTAAPVTPYSHAATGPLDNCRVPVVVTNSEL